jgi:hypothetical protein
MAGAVPHYEGMAMIFLPHQTESGVWQGTGFSSGSFIAAVASRDRPAG